MKEPTEKERKVMALITVSHAIRDQLRAHVAAYEDYLDDNKIHTEEDLLKIDIYKTMIRCLPAILDHVEKPFLNSELWWQNVEGDKFRSGEITCANGGIINEQTRA